jgi:hypothetical protein
MSCIMHADFKTPEKKHQRLCDWVDSTPLVKSVTAIFHSFSEPLGRNSIQATIQDMDILVLPQLLLS